MNSTKSVLREAEALRRGSHTADEILEQTRQLIARCVPFDAFVGAAFDPLSLVPVRALYSELRMPSEQLPRLLAIEMTDARHFNVADLPSRAREKASVLSAATGGMLTQSTSYLEMMQPFELEHSLRVQLRASGMLWGGVNLMRDVHARDFNPAEVVAVAELAGPLAEALRRSVLIDRAPGAFDDAPAVVVLSSDDHVVSLTSSAEDLLVDLANVGLADPDGLPAVLRAVALITRNPQQSALKPIARARTRSGSRFTVRGTALDGGQGVALVIEPSRAPESAWLTLAGYGLSERECTIALHVLRGLSTEVVGNLLGISEYTVQDHLKGIFDKTGFSTRRELAAHLFLATG